MPADDHVLTVGGCHHVRPSLSECASIWRTLFVVVTCRRLPTRVVDSIRATATHRLFAHGRPERATCKSVDDIADSHHGLIPYRRLRVVNLPAEFIDGRQIDRAAWSLPRGRPRHQPVHRLRTVIIDLQTVVAASGQFPAATDNGVSDVLHRLEGSTRRAQARFGSCKAWSGSRRETSQSISPARRRICPRR